VSHPCRDCFLAKKRQGWGAERASAFKRRGLGRLSQPSVIAFQATGQNIAVPTVKASRTRPRSLAIAAIPAAPAM
jgi:hypothetical protein